MRRRPTPDPYCSHHPSGPSGLRKLPSSCPPAYKLRPDPTSPSAVGVPKVAYKVPGAFSADWVDLYNRLYRERIIFLGQPIADAIANQIIGVMLTSTRGRREADVHVHQLARRLGDVGVYVFDTMRVKADVSTINVGLAASMGSFLLMGGTKAKWRAALRAR